MSDPTDDGVVAAMAKTLLSDEVDHLAVYEAMESILAPHLFVQLGAALELCPVHLCDIQICLDDGVHGDEVYLAHQP